MNAIVTQQPTDYSFVATAGQAAFPILCRIFNGYEDAFAVTVNGEDCFYSTAPVTNRQFLVAANVDETEGGTIDFGVGLDAGDQVKITRVLPLERNTNLPSAGPISVEALNEELSRIVALMQDLGGGEGTALRVDLASDLGFTLIKHKSAKANTYARSAAELARVGGIDEGNAFHFIDPDLDAAITAGANVDPLDVYLNNWLGAYPGGSRLTLPAFRWRIANPLNINQQGLNIVGGARNACQIEQSGLNKAIFNIAGTANFTTLSGFRTAYVGGVPVAGATAIVCPASYCHFSDFTLANSDIGLDVSGKAVKVHDFESLNYENIGFWVHNTNDVYARSFIINCGDNVRGRLGGIRLTDKAEAIIFRDGEVLMGVYSITMGATSNTLGNRPAYSKFDAVFFDSSLGDNPVNNSVEIDWMNCWFSCRPGSGLVLTNCDGHKFTGGGAINNGGHGALVQASSKNILFNGFSARGNSTTTPSTYDGISFAAGASDFSAIGCITNPGLGFGTQRSGIRVASGASDRYSIRGTRTGGVAAGAVTDLGTGVNKDVGGNF